MMTVNEVSKKTGVSIRTLHYYDQIGLLHPHEVTEAGYRLYNLDDLKRLRDILLLKELEFPLKQIREIIDNPNFDRSKVIKQQIQILNMKKNHLEDLISFALDVSEKGADDMDFTVFDTSKIEEYQAKAKELWGNTDAYKEYEQKTAGNTNEQNQSLGQYLMSIFGKFGDLLRSTTEDADPKGPKAQTLVKDLQSFITNNYYTCTKQILAGLGEMYAAEGEMKTNIDNFAGRGAADFAAEAIRYYCSKAS